LLDAVRQAMSTMSATNVRADTTPEPTTHDDYMNTAELAEMLGCSERHARRLADRLDARFDGRTKLVPRAAVLEHLEGLNAAAC
jgi:excisionase family DNA binding protein